MNISIELDECGDFSCIFKLVKIAVKRTTGRGRVGLILGLSNLPNHIGALHQIGSNFIIMNKNLLEKVLQTGDKKLINAYIFHILLHEYIHSLGYVNEQETEIITHAISEEVLGAQHPATLIARYGLGYVIRNISGIENQRLGRGIEIIKDLETDNLNYFG